MTAQSAREDAARAALSGHWTSPLLVHDSEWAGPYDDNIEVFPCGDERGPVCVASSVERAHHIALNDPAAILADIEEMQRLRAAVAIGRRLSAVHVEWIQSESNKASDFGAYVAKSLELDNTFARFDAALKEVSE